MLEASLVFFTLAVFTALDRWLAGHRPVWLAVATISFGLLVLTKIYMLVLFLPIGYQLWVEAGHRTVEEGRAVPGFLPDVPIGPISPRLAGLFIGLLVLAAIPAMVWFVVVMEATASGKPLADQVYYSLRHSAGSHRPPDPLLWNPDFYRQLFDDFSSVVLTPVGFVLPLVGLLHRAWRRYVVWMVAMMLIVAVMPRKFYETNYYYLVILPPICIVAGLGWEVAYRRLRPGRVALGLFLVLALAASLRYSAKPLLVIPAEDRAVLPASAALRQMTESHEPVATMHGTGIDLLYYCNRAGWDLSPSQPDIEQRLHHCRKQGGRFLVVVDVENQAGWQPAEGSIAQVPPVRQGDGYRIYELGKTP